MHNRSPSALSWLVLSFLALLTCCKSTPTDVLETVTVSPLLPIASSPLPGPPSVPDQALSTATPVSIPGVPDSVVTYAGVVKYLIPRLPNQQVLDRWNELSPPRKMRSVHREFAASMQEFMQAHQAFNDAAFNRSDQTVKEASQDLDLVMKAHDEMREKVSQALESFLDAEYGVSGAEIPEIVVSLQP